MGTLVLQRSIQRVRKSLLRDSIAARGVFTTSQSLLWRTRRSTRVGSQRIGR